MTIIGRGRRLPARAGDRSSSTKLINVIKIVEQDPAHSVSRELLMITGADASQRGEVLEVVNLPRARIIDVAPSR